MFMVVSFLKDKVNLHDVIWLLEGVDWKGKDRFVFFDLDTGMCKTFDAKKDLVSFLSNVTYSSEFRRFVVSSECEWTVKEYCLLSNVPFDGGEVVLVADGMVTNVSEVRERLAQVLGRVVDFGDVIDVSFMCKAIQSLKRAYGYGNKFFERLFYVFEGGLSLFWYDREDDLYVFAKTFSSLGILKRDNCLIASSFVVEDRFNEMDSYSFKIVNASFHTVLAKDKIASKLDDRKVLVVCSGGLDSTTVLRLYQVLGYDPKLVFFKYGQKAMEMEDYATDRVAEVLEVEKIVIDARDIFSKFTSTILGDEKVDVEHTPLFAWVPARNFIFASFVMGLAEEFGVGRIAFGLNASEAVYPDNTVVFARKLEEISGYALGLGKYLKVRAPLIGLTKKEIVEVGLSVGVPFEVEVSCTFPSFGKGGEILYCGKCESDVLRRRAFEALDVIDPALQRVGIITGCRSLSEVEGYVEARTKKVINPSQIKYFDRLYL